jgi:hypothetical protein
MSHAVIRDTAPRLCLTNIDQAVPTCVHAGEEAALIDLRLADAIAVTVARIPRRHLSGSVLTLTLVSVAREVSRRVVSGLYPPQVTFAAATDHNAHDRAVISTSRTIVGRVVDPLNRGSLSAGMIPHCAGFGSADSRKDATAWRQVGRLSNGRLHQ